MTDERCKLTNADCDTCKYSHRRWCNKDNKFRLCSSCEHRGLKDSKGYDCLCLLLPTNEELITGKCKYYEEAEEDQL